MSKTHAEGCQIHKGRDERESAEQKGKQMQKRTKRRMNTLLYTSIDTTSLLPVKDIFSFTCTCSTYEYVLEVFGACFNAAF